MHWKGGNMNEVQVFIASYNRSYYLRETINSVLAQTYIGLIDLIVSDNSTNDDVQVMMEKEYSSVKYVRRVPSLSVDQHFRAIICEVTSEFYMIFHDDDIMLPDMIESLYTKLINAPELMAVGSNAWYYYPDKDYEVKSFVCFEDISFRDKYKFTKKYLLGLGVSPFPSYMYRASVYKERFVDINDGGKYFDFSFILKGLDYGSILWLCKPLMRYRRHDSNDSNSIAFGDREKIIKYIVDHVGIKKKSIWITLYRMHDYNNILISYFVYHKTDLSRDELRKVIISALKNLVIILFISAPLFFIKRIYRFIDKKVVLLTNN